MAKPVTLTSHYVTATCLWALAILLAVALFWQPELQYGMYTIHVGRTGFVFDLRTFAPYLFSVLSVLVLASRLMKKTTSALVILTLGLGILNLVVSFFLSYGYTAYPALNALERSKDPQVVDCCLWISRALVLLVMISLTYRHLAAKHR